MEGGAAPQGQPPDHPVQGLLPPLAHREPVLHEAAPAVEPVPPGEGVQGVEEGRDALEPPGAHGARAPEAELGQERRRGPAEQPFGNVRRGTRQLDRTEHQRCAPGARRERVQRRVLRPDHHGAARGLPARQQVHPGRRVREVAAGPGEPGQRLVQVGRPLGHHRHPRGGDGPEREGGGEDDPGQPQSARRRGEEIGPGQHRADGAVGGQQLQGAHVPGERAGGGVVEAVQVGADGTADGDVPGGRGDREEPAQRQQHLHQAVQAHPGVADDRAGGGVDRVDAVQSGHVDHRTARVLRRVPVRPAQPAGDDPARPAARHGDRRLLVRTGAEPERGRRGGAAPAGHGHRVDGHGGDRIAKRNPFEGFVTALTEMGDWLLRRPRCSVFRAPPGTRRAWTG